MKPGLQWLLGVLLVITIIEISVLPGDARADEEGRMPLTHLQFDSKGLDNSGPVHAEVVQSDRGITDLKVSAFGKTQSLTPAQLTEISGVSFNSIGLTYSRGYADTGGRNVVLLLCQAFSSGVKIVGTVTITETGGIRASAGKSAGL